MKNPTKASNKLHFVLDVDGVLTTGQFLYSSDGKAYKVFGPHDADGLKLVKDKLNVMFISADKRGFSISERRAKDMGYPITLVTESERFDYVKNEFGFENVIYMGDGIYDAPLIKACKFGIAPANARREARQVADFITESKAGDGAVLDACLEIVNRFFNGYEASQN